MKMLMVEKHLCSLYLLCLFYSNVAGGLVRNPTQMIGIPVQRRRLLNNRDICPLFCFCVDRLLLEQFRHRGGNFERRLSPRQNVQLS